MRPKPEVMELVRRAIVAGDVSLALNSAWAELVRLDGEAEVSTVEERLAWDRYVSSALGMDPDKQLELRRKRFGSAT